MVVEPYKIKVCEPIRLPSREERETALREAGYNVYSLPSDKVYIDLLSDSGTSAMSIQQWRELLSGDESFSYQSGYFTFVEKVKEIFGFNWVLPLHQGRVGEHILFELTLKEGGVVPNNQHYSTTRANIEYWGGIPVDLVVDEAFDPHSPHPFKGDVDIERLKALLNRVTEGGVPLGVMTITNNTGGAQPVSVSNIQSVAQLLKEHGIPFFFDAPRFAENAYLIKEREEGYRESSIKDILRKTFSCADGCVVSAKKDALSNIGGFIAVNDEELARKVEHMVLLTEGFVTHGGLTGRDMETVIQGMDEALDEERLSYRIGQVRYLGDELLRAGIPVYQPFGGHAVYVVVKEFLPHLPENQFPGQALSGQLYLETGIRAAAVGTRVWYKAPPDFESRPPVELLRLSLPRRVYTRSHLEWVSERMAEVYDGRGQIRGLKVVYEPPWLKHYTAQFEPL